MLIILNYEKILYIEIYYYYYFNFLLFLKLYHSIAPQTQTDTHYDSRKIL